MIKHQGGCHCGQVRFQTEFDPLLVYQCNSSVAEEWEEPFRFSLSMGKQN